MAITLFYVGIPVVGVLAIINAVISCIKVKINGAEIMTPEADEFLSKFILKMVRIETVVLVLVISLTILLWRSMATMEANEFAFLCGATYLIMWADLVMMAYTFALTYQVVLSRKQEQGQQ